MTEDIYKLLLNSTPNMSLALLYRDDIELDEKSKVLVAINWVKSGSPSMYESRLISKLGEDWETYMNPMLHKLSSCKLDTLVRKVPMEYNVLSSSKFSPMIRTILSEKLEDLEYNIAPHGFTTSKNVSIDKSSRKLLSYKITSIGTKRELLRIELEAEGFTYTPRVYMLESGIDNSVNFTEQSLKNLKGLMYYMSEEDAWDVDRMSESIKFIDFKPTILNDLMSCIKSKYDK